LLTFLMATFLGAIFGVGGMMLGKHKRKELIPFGPFIAVGALLSYFYGENIISWYFSMFM